MHFGIFQNWGLGDLIMTTPVIAEFRRLYPHARLTLVVQGGAQANLLKESPLIDQILVMPARSDRTAMLRFFLNLRKEKFDVAFIGTRISALLPCLLKGLSGVPVVVGDGNRANFIYNVRNNIDPGVHRVDRMLATFAMWSGEATSSPTFPLPFSEVALGEVRADLLNRGLEPGRFVALHD